jgi:hypothetical protein
MTLQLRLGRTLLAASHCGQQTNNFIEETETRANIATGLTGFLPETFRKGSDLVGAIPRLFDPANIQLSKFGQILGDW